MVSAWTVGTGFADERGIVRADGSGAARQLWCAVIGRAVLDATDRVGATSNTGERRRIRDDARLWFTANNADFRHACESAGYDPDYLRLRVLALFEQAS
jgi:hypothetical protein